MKKYIAIVFVLAFSSGIHAQLGPDGDALFNLLGNKINTPVKSFFENYQMTTSTDTKYSSTKYGVNAQLKNEVLISIDLYQSNPIYGRYTNALPRNISFGMNPADLVKILGKPTTAYTKSGYAEYVLGKNVMTCWFEDGFLTQVSLSLK